jgi:hypothetical protein
MCVIDLTNVGSFYTHFIWDLFEIKSFDGKLSWRARKISWWEIILQSKKDSLIRDYLANQEKYKFYYLKLNTLMWNYLTEQENIAFMLLIIDKCLVTIELSPKGRNPNITPQTRTPWKKGGELF